MQDFALLFFPCYCRASSLTEMQTAFPSYIDVYRALWRIATRPPLVLRPSHELLNNGPSKEEPLAIIFNRKEATENISSVPEYAACSSKGACVGTSLGHEVIYYSNQSDILNRTLENDILILECHLESQTRVVQQLESRLSLMEQELHASWEENEQVKELYVELDEENWDLNVQVSKLIRKAKTSQQRPSHDAVDPWFRNDQDEKISAQLTRVVRLNLYPADAMS